MKYYVIKNNSIIIAEKEQALTNYYDDVFQLPTDYEQGKYIVENNSLVLNPNYEAEKQAKEKERINSLFMTRSDFFDGTIKAWGVDGDELLVIIQNLLATMSIGDIEKKVAINNYKNALNFYRKHPLFEMLSDVVIPINETTAIRIQAENWDKFFDETDKGNEEAYKWLYPIGEVIA